MVNRIDPEKKISTAGKSKASFNIYDNLFDSVCQRCFSSLWVGVSENWGNISLAIISAKCLRKQFCCLTDGIADA